MSASQHDPAIYLVPAQAYCDRILGASKPGQQVAGELWLRVVVDAARAPLLAEVERLTAALDDATYEEFTAPGPVETFHRATGGWEEVDRG